MKYDKLIIVESPAKAKTISKFVDNAVVLASKGHIRDLPSYTLGVKIENGKFIPHYEITPDHKHIVSEIKDEARVTGKVYLASDEDREGEAIGYHIATILGGDPLSYDRIVFHEITKSAILKALENPRKLNMHAVEAQETRRILDRIVGYKLSPLVNNKVASKLSAGRVQSAVLKLVNDREKEITKFVPVTYYELPITVRQDTPASLVSHKDLKITKQCLQDKNQALGIKASIEKDSFKVSDISSKKASYKPQPPFKTTTLQQAASTELGYDPTKVMSIAQKLYEGVDTPNGRKGVITYMRTDSLNLADEAIKAIRNQILKDHGKEYLPNEPRVYENKTKGAQEAHEAIRVTDITFTLDDAKRFLELDQFKVYKLIYNRTMMCQMSDSQVENQTVLINGNENVIKIVGRKVLFDGWTKLKDKTAEDILLPPYSIGSEISIQAVKLDEKQTEPPARYNAASLVKTMEDLGIGRPSTYAATINLLLKKQYVKTEGKAMFITETGQKLSNFLEKHFEDVVDDKFTSIMESKLDDIALGKTDMNTVLNGYCTPLLAKIEKAFKEIPSEKPEARATGEICPKCKEHELVIRTGKNGEFKACSGYPKCKYVEHKEVPVDEAAGKCPNCGKGLIKREGRFGVYYGCSGYPDCKFLTKYPIAKEKCPKCGNWQQEVTSKDGNTYLRCLKCNPPKVMNKPKPNKSPKKGKK